MQNAGKQSAATIGGKFSGIKEVKIVSAITWFKLDTQKNPTSEYVELTVNVLETGKNIKLKNLTISNEKGEITNEGKLFQNLIYLTNPEKPDDQPFIVEKAIATVYDFDAKMFVEKPVEQYTEVIGQRVLANIVLKHKFKNKRVYGYTDRLAPKFGEDGYEESKTSPEIIYMPDYNTDMNIEFSVLGFYDATTHKTLLEIVKGLDEPRQYEKDLAKNKQYDEDFKEVALSPEAYSNELKKRLMKSLENAKVAFDNVRWSNSLASIGSVPKTTYTTTTSNPDIIPF